MFKMIPILDDLHVSPPGHKLNEGSFIHACQLTGIANAYHTDH